MKTASLARDPSRRFSGRRSAPRGFGGGATVKIGANGHQIKKSHEGSFLFGAQDKS